MVQKIKNFIKETYPLKFVIVLRNRMKKLRDNLITLINNKINALRVKINSIYAFEYFEERKAIKCWQRNGRSIPSPPEFKRLTVKKYARKYGIKYFIESGTFLGHMVHGVRHNFHKIYTIEIDEKLYLEATQKFQQYPYIRLYQGDSGKLIPILLENISESCLFWLDAHYSGGITGGEGLKVPIILELEAILSHHIKSHCILIDDARCFFPGFTNIQDGFPNIEDLKRFILMKRHDALFEVQDDIIRITFNCKNRIGILGKLLSYKGEKLELCKTAEPGRQK